MNNEKYSYRSADLIGEGSFGKVYRGENLLTGQTVAFKVIPKMSRSESELKSLKQECDILRTLNHPNIIQLLDSFETKDVLVLVTEYARGSLFQLLRKEGPMSSDRVRTIARNLVSALHYLHSNRIFHRDIKPQNILLGQDGLVKLCDFGFARKIGLGTYVLTSVKGTPLYMAPEVIDNKAYDQSADLWSLGCILYELIVGKPPFFTNSIHDLANMVKNDPVKWPSTVTSKCLSFLQGLLEKDPKKRLMWPKLLDHPFVANAVYVKSGGPFPLTKALSPSQELAKEHQRDFLEKKLNNYTKLISRTHRKVKETRKKLNECSGDVTPSTTKTEKDKSPKDKTKVRRSSSSSCETLTSSSSPGHDSENEDVKTIIVDSGNKCSANGTQVSPDDLNLNKCTIATGKEKDISCNPKEDQNHIVLADNNIWTSGALFTLHSFGSEDKPIESEEWVDFLQKIMREVIRNPYTLCEKHILTIIVAPLRNHLASMVVVDKIAALLSLPFTMEAQTTQTPDLMRTLENLYLDTKVVPNLLYACQLCVRGHVLGRKNLDLQSIALSLPDEDLEGFHGLLGLMNYLVHSQDDFVTQFCDSVCVLQVSPILKLLLKLDSRKSALTSHTLAILCHVVRISPSNVQILEELFLSHSGEESAEVEIWRFLNHSETSIQAKTLRILAYMILFSDKANEFVNAKWSRLWNLLRNCSSGPNKEAADFLSLSLRYGQNNTKIEVSKSPIP